MLNGSDFMPEFNLQLGQTSYITMMLNKLRPAFGALNNTIQSIVAMKGDLKNRPLTDNDVSMAMASPHSDLLKTSITTAIAIEVTMEAYNQRIATLNNAHQQLFALRPKLRLSKNVEQLHHAKMQVEQAFDDAIDVKDKLDAEKEKLAELLDKYEQLNNQYQSNIDNEIDKSNAYLNTSTESMHAKAREIAKNHPEATATITDIIQEQNEILSAHAPSFAQTRANCLKNGVPAEQIQARTFLHELQAVVMEKAITNVLENAGLSTANLPRVNAAEFQATQINIGNTSSQYTRQSTMLVNEIHQVQARITDLADDADKVVKHADKIVNDATGRQANYDHTQMVRKSVDNDEIIDKSKSSTPTPKPSIGD